MTLGQPAGGRHRAGPVPGTGEQVRAITGFDRVAVYRFAPDDSGEVMAEDVREDLPPWLGMHYPATDIPKQARAMYLKNWLRFIPDARYVPVPLVPAAQPRHQPPARHDLFGAAQRVAHSPRIPAQHGFGGHHDHFAHSGRAAVGHGNLPPPDARAW